LNAKNQVITFSKTLVLALTRQINSQELIFSDQKSIQKNSFTTGRPQIGTQTKILFFIRYGDLWKNCQLVSRGMINLSTWVRLHRRVHSTGLVAFERATVFSFSDVFTILKIYQD